MTLYEHLKRRLGQDGPGLDTGVTPGQGLGPVSAQGPGLKLILLYYNITKL